MKTKDILIVVVAIIVIGACGYFGYTLLSPAPKNSGQTAQSKNQNLITVPAQIDENTFTTVSTLSDYGTPNLTGIGKSDLFK